MQPLKIRRGSLSISAHICLGDTIIREKTQTQKGKWYMISCIKSYNLELTEVESTMEVSEPCGGEGGDEAVGQKVQTPS